MRKASAKNARSARPVWVVSSSAEHLSVAKDALRSAGIEHEARIIKARIKKRGDGPDSPRLTRQEINVLQVISDQGTIAKTAAALGISPKTIQTHLAHVRYKLPVATTVQAVTWAWRRGLIA